MGSPIAVRLLAAVNPIMFNSAISSDGISSEAGSCALVNVPRCDHATRNSFERLLPSTLFIHVFSECSFDVLTVVSPGGVTCPEPEFSGVRASRYRDVIVWLESM